MWLSGPNSWARMIMAIRPPIRKNANEVIRYRWPMTLWSVDDSQLARIEPLRSRATPVPGVTTGCSTVVTSCTPC